MRKSDASSAKAVLTESTYADDVVGAPTRTGHPDNEDELFASTTAVLRTFPNALLQKFYKLPVPQQKEVAGVVDTVVAAYKSANADARALRALLPEAPKVAQAMHQALKGR